MRALLVIAAILLSGGAGRADPWAERHLVTRGALAAVYVDKTLYRRADLPRGFFVSVWIRNLGDRPLGIEGTGERWFFHPNQWAASDEPKRTAVDERIALPQRLDEARRASLRARYARGQLVMLAPGSSLQAYAPFDGTEVPSDADHGRYLILSFDGQALVTDGKRDEVLDARGGTTRSDLALVRPPRWETLPLPPAK